MKLTILVHAKNPLPPVLMASFFEHIATLFFISKNYFHHALALSKYSTLKRDLEATDAEVEKMYVENNIKSKSTLIPPHFHRCMCCITPAHSVY